LIAGTQKTKQLTCLIASVVTYVCPAWLLLLLLLICVLAGSKAASPFPDGSGSSAHDPYWAVISEVRELHTAASDRSCVHIEIDISGKRCAQLQAAARVEVHVA
jgi:hypothetical protein